MTTAQKIASAGAATLAFVAPAAAFAQVGGTPPGSFSPNLTALGQVIINQVWIFFTILAVICFIISAIQFLTSGGDPEKVQKARSSFLWGVAGVVVGVIAFTIVALIRGALGA
jgi:hypothetical protein